MISCRCKDPDTYVGTKVLLEPKLRLLESLLKGCFLTIKMPLRYAYPHRLSKHGSQAF